MKVNISCGILFFTLFFCGGVMASDLEPAFQQGKDVTPLIRSKNPVLCAKGYIAAVEMNYGSRSGWGNWGIKVTSEPSGQGEVIKYDLQSYKAYFLDASEHQSGAGLYSLALAALNNQLPVWIYDTIDGADCNNFSSIYLGYH